jgi:hypothetical protein
VIQKFLIKNVGADGGISLYHKARSPACHPVGRGNELYNLPLTPFKIFLSPPFSKGEKGGFV